MATVAPHLPVAPPSNAASDGEEVLGTSKAWTLAAPAYQDAMGQCTLTAAESIISQLHTHLPFTSSSYLLDNGCGGGSIVRILKTEHPSVRAMASDISPGMVDKVAALHLPGVETMVSDGMTLDGLADNSFTHVATHGMIQFPPDASACVRSMYRVLAPGGLAAIAIWGERMDFREANNEGCRRVLPEYKPRSNVAKGAWKDEKKHAEEMRAAGFKDVKVSKESIRFPVRDTAHYMQNHFWGTNAVRQAMRDDFVSQGGDLQKSAEETEKIVKEDYDDGQKLMVEVVIGLGWK